MKKFLMVRSGGCCDSDVWPSAAEEQQKDRARLDKSNNL